MGIVMVGDSCGDQPLGPLEKGLEGMDPEM